MGTLKLHNRPLYSSMLMGTLAVDGWAVTVVLQGGDWAGCGPPTLLLAVLNVIAHPSMASLPISYHSMWHYNCHGSLTLSTLSAHTKKSYNSAHPIKITTILLIMTK